MVTDFVPDNLENFDYDYILNLPAPAISTILRYLRIPELISLKSTCPELGEACDLQLKLAEKEFPLHPFFRFERFAPETEETDEDVMMSERMNASTTFYPPNLSVYLFGGESTRSNDEYNRPTFNDLWRLDTVTMKWSRVVISSAPYPLAKYGASLVTWKEKLILFGGHRPFRDNVFMTFESEMHYFDISTSTWEYISAAEAPSLSMHSAVISGDLMMCYGGWHEMDNFSEIMHIYDIMRECWGMVRFSKLDEKDEEPFPSLDPAKTKLVQIRPGLLLITGEMSKSDYGSSVLIRYDPEDVYGCEWKWKKVETSGRWWKPKLLAENRPDPECSMPNFDFFEIAEVRGQNQIRLVSLGRLKNEYPLNRSSIIVKYDLVQATYRLFCRELKFFLEEKFHKLSKSNFSETCATFEYDDVICHIEGCFSQNSNSRQNRFKIHIQTFPISDANKQKFDEFDIWEMKCSIRALVNQLLSKYSNASRMEHLAARLPNRNGLLKRLSCYVAHIDCNVDFEKFDELRWEPQPLQYPSPVVTQNFRLIGANHDVIMHSGAVKFNETMIKMGPTTMLTPIFRI